MSDAKLAFWGHYGVAAIVLGLIAVSLLGRLRGKHS